MYIPTGFTIVFWLFRRSFLWDFDRRSSDVILRVRVCVEGGGRTFHVSKSAEKSFFDLNDCTSVYFHASAVGDTVLRCIIIYKKYKSSRRTDSECKKYDLVHHKYSNYVASIDMRRPAFQRYLYNYFWTQFLI